MERAEHLAWAKARALEYLPNSPALAFASFLSDIGKHEDIDPTGMVRELGATLALSGFMNTAKQVRDFVEGAN